jgi:hypothetical protein
MMAIEILRNGSEGRSVTRWQNFLIGQRRLRSVADGIFGPVTEKATKAFQRDQELHPDGIVGPQTLGKALLLGYDAGFTDRVEPETNPTLTGESEIRPLNDSGRKRLFGSFEYEPDPSSHNRERIRVLDGWEGENIRLVTIPQLQGIPVFGRPSSGRMRFHRKAEEQLKSMWAAWEQAGLLALVLTYDGSYNARFIRGSRSVLSNHAYGSAFDINTRWNPLGAVPALAGEEGSVRELVSIANEHGFYWGGHFNNRPDGMHFEVARLL